MKSNIWVVSIVLGITMAAASAADTREDKVAELNTIKETLKPLREKAYLEADVIAARKKLDDAYRDYWETLRTAMSRLDPSKKKLIEKEVTLRKETGYGAGSRAEDYEKKATAKASPTPAKKK